MSDGYIYVRNWDKFQHYKNRRPPWIKLYLDLLGDDAWIDLAPADAKLLVGIWMLTAMHGNGRIRVGNGSGKSRNGSLTGQLGARKGSIDRLIHAGFIEVRASKAASDPASTPAPPETETERETEAEVDQSSLESNGQSPVSSKPALELVQLADHKEIRAKDINPDTEFAIQHLLKVLKDQDEGTVGRLVQLARRGAGPVDFHDARQAVLTVGPDKPSRYACRTIEERVARKGESA